MTSDRAIHTLLGICAAILTVAALHLASSIFVPLAFSIFVIATVWPVQRALRKRVPELLALAITLLGTIVVISVLAAMMVWAFSKVGQWLIGNAARFQMLYAQTTAWLEGHGIVLGALFADYFNVSWLIRAFGDLTGRIQGLLSFLFITFTFVFFGLLEVDKLKNKLRELKNRELAENLLRAGADIAAKFQGTCSCGR